MTISEFKKIIIMDTGIKADSGVGGGLRKTKGGRRKRERWEGGDRKKRGRKGRERVGRQGEAG